MKYQLLKVLNKTFAVQAPVRVLEQYEYRPVQGRIVNAVHFSDQLADLGILLGLGKTSQKKALLIRDGFGLLVDCVEDVIDTDKLVFIAYPKLVVEQKGSMLAGEIEFAGRLIPVLAAEPNKHLQDELDREKAERVWI